MLTRAVAVALRGDHGTLFLGIGEILLSCAVRLLRVVGGRRFYARRAAKSSDGRSHHRRFKLIPERSVEQARFRRDPLFIVSLFSPFSCRFASALKKSHPLVIPFSNTTIKTGVYFRHLKGSAAALTSYNWPGNVREWKTPSSGIIIASAAYELDDLPEPSAARRWKRARPARRARRSRR